MASVPTTGTRRNKMIQKILKNIRKYHEANFWIAERLILEEKKQALKTSSGPEEETNLLYQTEEKHPQVVFTHYDSGHSQEERGKIQELYEELGNAFGPRRLAI